MSSLSDLFNRLTLNIFDSSERQKKIDQYNANNDLRAWLSMNHQFDYDSWAQSFAQKQFDYQQEIDSKQYQLATSPVSTVINDAAKVGISPMAALGQSAGSVSTGSTPIPSSNVQNAQMGVPSSPSSSLGSALGLLSNIVLSNKELQQEDEHFNKELGFRYQQLKVQSALKAEQNALANVKNQIQQKHFVTVDQILTDFNISRQSLQRWQEQALEAQVHSLNQKSQNGSLNYSDDSAFDALLKIIGLIK